MKQTPTYLPIDEVWITYARDHCRCHRNILIERYLPLVERVARKMSRATPPQVDYEDIRSYGISGLMRAIEHFQLESKIGFETYAVASIRGVIMDELRSIDWAPRSLRKRQREVDKAKEALELATGREPTVYEIATKLGLPISDVSGTIRATEHAQPRSLDEPGDESNISKYDQLADTPDTGPESRLVMSSILADICDEIEQLEPKERITVVLYYYTKMNLTQVGRVIGIPESRASQIHTKIALRLRERLHDIVSE